MGLVYGSNWGSGAGKWGRGGGYGLGYRLKGLGSLGELARTGGRLDQELQAGTLSEYRNADCSFKSFVSCVTRLTPDMISSITSLE